MLNDRGYQKKQPDNDSSTDERGADGYPIGGFIEQLRGVCEDHGGSAGVDRARSSKDQAERACAIAGKLGILKKPGLSWSEFVARTADQSRGTEHIAERDYDTSLMVKITIPPGFGLIPKVISHSVPNLRDDPSIPPTRQSIEFVPATPLEYLDRWQAANDVFEDDVKLASVTQWSDGLVSFVVTQPQYHGVPPTFREIEAYFEGAGWKRFVDANNHVCFFHYAFQVMCMDALPRNCYVHEGNLLPFDVILCRPDDAMETLLGLYPG